MFGMWIKKWSRIREIARHTVCMVLPNSLLLEQNLPPFRALSATRQCLMGSHGLFGDTEDYHRPQVVILKQLFLNPLFPDAIIHHFMVRVRLGQQY